MQSTCILFGVRENETVRRHNSIDTQGLAPELVKQYSNDLKKE
jgi:hypothetical protein